MARVNFNGVTFGHALRVESTRAPGKLSSRAPRIVGFPKRWLEKDKRPAQSQSRSRMKTESPWKRNPLLNIGILVMSAGMLTLTIFDKAQLLGTIVAVVGALMFFFGYRKAKAPGAPPPPRNDRRKKLRILMICFVVSFLGSPIILWSEISKLRGVGIWVFVIGDVVCFFGLLSFFAWQYKKAGHDSTDGA